MMRELSLVVLFLAALTALFLDGVQSNDDVIAAIDEGDKEKLMALFSNGTDINGCLQPMDETPLNFAILWSKEELALFLIKMGADLNASCEGSHFSPLVAAMKTRSKTLVKVLLEKGVEIDDEFLSDIIRYDKIDILELVLQNGFDPNKECNSCNHTWLYPVVLYGRVNLTKLLLEKGADIDHINCEGTTALNWACWNRDGSQEADDNLQRSLEFLIESGANVNTAYNISEKTPLMCAAAWGSTTLVKKLTKKGADVNAMDKEGNTPWSLASKYRNEIAAKFLLDHGADIHKGEKLRKKLAENKPQSRK